VLLALILLVFVLPYWWPAQRPQAPGKEVLRQLQGTGRQPGQGRNAPGEGAGDAAHGGIPAYAPGRPGSFHGRLFYFDPNTLDFTGWQELGLRDKTIQTVLHYREKGGRFRRPEDIGKIYGLFKDEYARLLPYVRIVPADTARKTYSRPYAAVYSADTVNRGHYIHLSKGPPRIIDINTADTGAFIALPGIGSRLANRIIHFREALGGFYSVEQVSETYALPDSVFFLIKPLLRCDSNAVRRININTADANALKQHPYLRWNMANAIVEYRKQHGEYKSVEELLRIEIIGPALFQKLRPYLNIQ
ncbi:MAG TPA: helix-hairpin-helix domain-containing protein, partial [Chitinophagaceae bacterium]|nr:helix-hairpin-helix domain-containing protein [Chitinophagaceae bacterium]